MRDSGPGDKPEQESKDRRAKAVAEHEPHYLFALRSKRDSNADLGATLGDDVGEDSEQTYCREHQRNRREGEQQGGIEAGIEGGLAHDLVHGEDVGHGEVWIDAGDRLLDRKSQAACGLRPANYQSS